MKGRDRDDHVSFILKHLDGTASTVTHAGWFLCRMDTIGMPPAEGVADSPTDAASMAGNIRWLLGHVYIQPWARA